MEKIDKSIKGCTPAAKEQPTACWNGWFEQLREFKAQFGHCRVPRREDSPDRKLGNWVTNQHKYYAKLYKDGKPSRMTAGRSRKLESIEYK